MSFVEPDTGLVEQVPHSFLPRRRPVYVRRKVLSRRLAERKGSRNPVTLHANQVRNSEVTGLRPMSKVHRPHHSD